MLAVRSDDEARLLGDRGSALLPAADAGDLAVAEDLLDREVLPDLGAGRPGRVHQHPVEQRAARAAHRLDALVAGIPPGDHGVALVEADVAGHRRARLEDGVEQAPPG